MAVHSPLRFKSPSSISECNSCLLATSVHHERHARRRRSQAHTSREGNKRRFQTTVLRCRFQLPRLAKELLTYPEEYPKSGFAWLWYAAHSITRRWCTRGARAGSRAHAAGRGRGRADAARRGRGRRRRRAQVARVEATTSGRVNRDGDRGRGRRGDCRRAARVNFRMLAALLACRSSVNRHDPGIRYPVSGYSTVPGASSEVLCMPAILHGYC